MALRRVSDLPNLNSKVQISKNVLSNCLIEVSYANPDNDQGSHVYQSYFVNLYDALSAFNTDIYSALSDIYDTLSDLTS